MTASLTMDAVQGRIEDVGKSPEAVIRIVWVYVERMTTLHLMVGLPCSGKTTLAKKMEDELGALRLTPDEWHRFLYGQDATHPEHDQRHARIELLQWKVAAIALERGLDVILDFGFWAKAERDDYRNRASMLGAGTKIHFLDVPFEELLERLKVRNSRSLEEVTVIPLPMMKEYLLHFQPPMRKNWRRTPCEVTVCKGPKMSTLLAYLFGSP